MSKLGHLSPTMVFLQTVRVLRRVISSPCMLHGKCSVFIPSFPFSRNYRSRPTSYSHGNSHGTHGNSRCRLSSSLMYV